MWNKQAFEAAMIDGDQHLVHRVLGWRGDPNVRTTLEFDVRFADGDVVKLPWSQDLHSTRQFEEYCDQEPLLFPLRFSAQEAPKRLAELKRAPITSVQPGDLFYLDLRWYGTQWYESLELPEFTTRKYVVQARYMDWSRVVRAGRKILVEVPLFKETLKPWTNQEVYLHGSLFRLAR